MIEKLMNQLRLKNWLSEFLIIGSLVIPGLMFLYIRQPQTLTNSNPLISILLAISYSLPCFLIIHSGLKFSWFEKESKEIFMSVENTKTELEILKSTTQNEAERKTIEHLLKRSNNQADYVEKFVQFSSAEVVLMTLYINMVIYFAGNMSIKGSLFGFDIFLLHLYAFQIFAAILFACTGFFKKKKKES